MDKLRKLRHLLDARGALIHVEMGALMSKTDATLARQEAATLQMAVAAIGG